MFRVLSTEHSGGWGSLSPAPGILLSAILPTAPSLPLHRRAPSSAPSCSPGGGWGTTHGAFSLTSCCECRRRSGFHNTPHTNRHTTHRQHTQCLTQTFASLLAPSQSCEGMSSFSHYGCTPPPAVQSTWCREGEGELRAGMPRTASLPVFWVPLHPVSGAINNTLHKVGGSGIPVAHPPQRDSETTWMGSGGRIVIVNTNAPVTMRPALL